MKQTFPQRKPLRLREYDYAQPGIYFVTICTQDKQCLFGDIRDDRMIGSAAQHMIKKWWVELPNKFPKVGMDSFVVMPNHLYIVYNPLKWELDEENPERKVKGYPRADT